MDKQDHPKTKVSVIIPAYNEGGTIANVVDAALRNSAVGEVIVVDDGSADDTGQAARLAGAKVIRLANNCGKATAMDAGAAAAINEIIVFSDADLIGLGPNHLSLLFAPVLDGRADMNIGILERRSLFLNRLTRIFPLISGERALTKAVWRSIPKKYINHFEIEIALNYHAKKFGFRSRSFYLSGISQVIKETKHGLLKGLAERAAMIADIIRISFKLYILDRFSTIASRLYQKRSGLGTKKRDLSTAPQSWK